MIRYHIKRFSTDELRVKQMMAKILLLLMLVLPVHEAVANIPFKVSVKFFVDEFGDRPSAGEFNTDAEVYGQEGYGNTVLANMTSELRMEIVEIIDLPSSLSGYLDVPISSTGRDDIRAAAVQDPVTWSWRSDAINVYVAVGGKPDDAGAISKFPPTNNIILMGQNISIVTLLHELGHSLDLIHTHETASSQCTTDTLIDNKDWSKDEMAVANYGQVYDLLTAIQKKSVDYTYHNVMSYHTSREYLTDCQKEVISKIAYDDKSWMLSRTPVYISYSRSTSSCKYNQFITCVGSYLYPFQTYQDALNFGFPAGSPLVFDTDSYTVPSASINTDVDIYTRQGVTILGNDLQRFRLPNRLERSQNSTVSNAARQAKRESTLSRKVIKDAEKNIKASMVVDPVAIRKYAKDKSKEHKANVIKHFKTAEQYATGDEKLVIQMELAQRYKQEGNYQLCFNYYKRVSNNTDQEYLKVMTSRYADQCKEDMTKKKRIKQEVSLE